MGGDSSLIEFSLRGFAFTNATAQVALRFCIDSAGTPIYTALGGGYLPSTSDYPNLVAGAGPVYLAGLSTTAHTVKLQAWVNTVGISLYCRAATGGPLEHLGLQVVEHK